jgi:hypothetical protein
MKAIRIAAAVVGLCSAILSYPAFSTMNNVAADAAVVYLRVSCIEGSSPQVTLNNCFDGSSGVSDLTTWISGMRQPTASSPLVVEVGPGSYARIVCGNWGYTTFRGAGRAQTVFTSAGSTGALSASSGCTEVEFQHLTLKASGFLSRGVAWNTNGNSRWLDVDVVGQMYGWYDTGGGKHYWNSSRIISTGFPGAFSKAYKTVGENWFFGSELHAQATDQIVDVIALEQQGSLSDTHFYGSVVRVDASASADNLTALAVSGGSAHVHGTGIDVVSSAPNNSVVALRIGNGASVHANGTAYNLSPGSGGTVTRIVNNGGHVHAPYLWEEHPTPPNITSVDGADMAVVTTSGGTPKFVIYSETCSSKWYDVGANACRP